MLDSIYHRTLKLLKILNLVILPFFSQHCDEHHCTTLLFLGRVFVVFGGGGICNANLTYLHAWTFYIFLR